MQVSYPQVTLAEADKFSKVWTYNGIVINLDNAAKQFATDFSNTLLKQLFMQMAEAATTERRAAELNPDNSKSIVSA